MRITVRKKRKMKHHPPYRRKYDISKLQNPYTATTFEAKLSQELSSNPVNDQFVDEKWRNSKYCHQLRQD